MLIVHQESRPGILPRDVTNQQDNFLKMDKVLEALNERRYLNDQWGYKVFTIASYQRKLKTSIIYFFNSHHID